MNDISLHSLLFLYTLIHVVCVIFCTYGGLVVVVLIIAQQLRQNIIENSVIKLAEYEEAYTISLKIYIFGNIKHVIY